MTAKSKAVKQEVTIKAPKITTAWLKVVEVTGKNEAENTNAILALVSEMQKSSLSIRDIQKVIKETKKESATLKISHVEGLMTWAEMREKFTEFRTIPLSSQLAKATAAYKLLGTGTAAKLPSLEVVEKETATARKAKANKAKAPKTTKAKTTNKEVLQGFLTYLMALNAESLTDSEIDLLSDISLRIIELEPVTA